MSGLVLVINPNSNPAVTHGIAEALAPLMLPDGPVIECVMLAGGPTGIESQADVEQVALPLRDMVLERTDADVFVIACFSDPGLHACREATKAPVLGIGECSVMAALMQGYRFGVIALGPSSVRRQARSFRQMEVASRWAGSAPLHMSVAEAERPNAYPRVLAVGQDLVEAGAETIILGCAGMARHRAALAAGLGVPVIDPTQAAAGHALSLVLLGGERNAGTTRRNDSGEAVGANAPRPDTRLEAAGARHGHHGGGR
jgi:Asp/Glu/hydantoin racemase